MLTGGAQKVGDQHILMGMINTQMILDFVQTERFGTGGCNACDRHRLKCPSWEVVKIKTAPIRN